MITPPSKRWAVLTIVLSLLAVVTYMATAGPGRSQQDTTVSIGSAIALPNSQATVELTVTPGSGIEVYAVVVDVTYDTALLSAGSCTTASWPGSCNPAYAPDQVRLVPYSLSGISGVIGTITFDTLAIEGIAPLTVTVQDCIDVGGDPITCVAVDGTITVTLSTPTPSPSPTPAGTPSPPPFDPGGVMCFEDLESGAECDGNTAPGATSDIRTKLCIGWNDDCTVRDATVNDSNFGGIVGFTPSDWNVPTGASIPIGAIAGRLASEAWLGLLNGPCSNGVDVAFTMLNASTNVNDAISPRQEGLTDVMQPLAQDVNPANGIPDGADRYPAFLADLFGGLQPRARLFGISHIQGTWTAVNVVVFQPGVTLEVAGSPIHFDPALGYPSITILQDPTAQAAPSAISDFCAPLLSLNTALGKTINNPCTPTSVAGANCPVTADEEPETVNRGYPAFPCDSPSKFDDDGDGKINDGCPQVNNISEQGAQCDNETSDDGEDSAINDGCPAFGPVSEGSRMPGDCSGSDEGGCTHRANPGAAGAVDFTALLVSQRDADGDGIENGLDVCALVANPGWDPRAQDTGDDADNDGLPNVCDPAPSTGSPGSPVGCKSGYTGGDHDQDCFANRADNCPTVTQLLNPALPPDNYPGTFSNPPLAPDADRDGIGDACDPDVNAPNGDYIGYCLSFALNVGGANGAVTGVRDATLAPQCATQGPTPPPTPNPHPPGDADCDGNVDAVDALYVLRSVAGLAVPGTCLPIGNVDCSPLLTAADVLGILRFVVGLIPGLPIVCALPGIITPSP